MPRRPKDLLRNLWLLLLPLLYLLPTGAGASDHWHWAFQVPVRLDPPSVEGAPVNPIDAFVRARLEEQHLSASPEADPRTLLRRLYLDLTGLLPTPAETDAFVAATQKNPGAARREVVKKLLASPHYGERWGRHWLDVARYADSNGFQQDGNRHQWPWRDWVIAALNEDKPFDQFTIEQLAGDLLPDATESQKIATAFHRNTPLNLEAGTDPEEDHYKQIVDRVNTTGTIWLGSTVGCAQCHNHKYDPLSTREYYELFAFFNNTPMESRQEGEEMGMSNMIHIGPVLEVTRNIADIDAEGLMIGVEDKKVMQPFGDRSQVVIEPMLTDQWFADAKTLAKPAIASVREGRTNFVPKNWEKTYFEWMENIQPWCVSRQLWWGHQIPAWYGPDGHVFVAKSEKEALDEAVKLLEDVEWQNIQAEQRGRRAWQISRPSRMMLRCAG